MNTLKEAETAALTDINLLRALVKQTDVAGIDTILKSVPIKPIILSAGDLAQFLHELTHFKSERLTAAQLVQYYNSLEQRLVTTQRDNSFELRLMTTQHDIDTGTPPPPTWRE